MTRQDFFQYITHPENLDSHTIPILEKLVQEYPYFQIGRMLYLKNTHNENSIQYEKNLNVVSAYSPGGKALYHLIKKKIKVIPEEELATKVLKEEHALSAPAHITPPSPDIIKADKKDEFDELELLQNEMLHEAYRTSLTIKNDISSQETIADKTQLDRSYQQTTDQTHSFNEWLQIIGGKSSTQVTQKAEQAPSIQKSQKKEIINKFILSEVDKLPKKTKAEFYSADVMAKRSVQDNETMVSETLASIYLKQGNLPKALRAYEILLTKHPEKVHIFAPLLEKIKKLIEEQKTK